MALKKRDVQTQVKHIILSEYLGTWAGIILNGKAGVACSQALRGRPFQARLVYVDGFSYKGRYEGDTTDVMLNGTPSLPTWGSPILGIQALDKAQKFAVQKHEFHTDIATILVEDDDDDFLDLQESLRLAGFEQRVLLNPPVIAPPDGKISLRQGNFLTYAEPILGYIAQPYTNALLLLDPYGPKGLPYATVSRIVAHQDADVMINLPYQDLHKKLGYLLNEGGRPGDHALLANYDAMFGTVEWRTIATRVKAEVPPAEQTERFEEELANFYLERLRAADPTLVVKNIRLQFPDKERTMFYLYLTTHDPTGALALNKILYDANLSQYALKWNRQQAKWMHESHQEGQLTLFDTGMDKGAPPPLGEHPFDIDQLAGEIGRLFAHQQPKLRDIYAALASSDYFVLEVERALRLLKRKKLIAFDELRANTVIHFGN